MAQGKLDAFESDARSRDVRRSENREHHGSSRKHEDPFGDCLSDACAGVLSDCFEIALLYGGACSWERAAHAEPSDSEIVPRELGEPLIPFARVDLAYQNVASDVDAADVRAEGGFGPVGIQGRFTRYWEQTPETILDLGAVFGAYRMSFGAHVEADLGLGVLTMNGEDTTARFSVALPVLVHPGKHWGVEFRPAWASGVSDYDFALLLSCPYTSVKLGYRWLASQHESLDGPYVGVSLRL
jgi:hypothetical protein